MTIDRRPQHVIYDLDGVLLDTEPFYTQATRSVVGRFGKEFDWSLKANMIGRPAIESARYLVEALELPITPEQYLEERRRELERLFPGSLPRDGAERFTRLAARAGVRQAVATSSEREIFELKTGRLRGWFDLFEAVVCGDDGRLKAGKPAPDIFLLAAGDLGVPAQDCLVFEDSPVGVQAARAAGMQVVAVPDPAMAKDAFREADLIVEGFSGLTPRELGLGT